MSEGKQMMKPDAHERAYEPRSLEEARRILREACRGGKHLCPSQAAELIWPGKKFLSAQGAALAAGGVLGRLKKMKYARQVGEWCRWVVY